MSPTFGGSLDVTGTRRRAVALSSSFVFSIAVGTVGPAGVMAAEYNPATDVNSMPSTTDYVGADSWWDAGYTGKGITVALIDTGVAPVDGLRTPGKIIYGPDLSLESQAPELSNLDTYGHGTFMAGLIAGHDDALTAPYSQAPASVYRGMAPDAKILSVKVGTADGGTDVSQVIAAIDWVVQHKNDNGMNVRILNLSYGTNSTQGYVVDPLSFAVEQAWKAGIVVVAAAGNSGYQKGANAPGLADPAYNPMVIAVGGSDSVGTPVVYDDDVASFSANSNACNLACRNPDFIAPGAHIQGLRVPNSYIDLNYPGGVLSARYLRGSGTSESAAIASGAAALILDKHPTFTPDQVKAFLNQGAAHLAGGVEKPRCQPRVRRRRLRHGDQGERWEREPAAEAEQRHRQQQVADVDHALGLEREDEQGERDHQLSRDQDPEGAEAHHQPGREPDREAAHDDGDREEAQAEGQGAVTKDALEVERGHEEEAEEGGRHQRLHGVGAGQRQRAEEPQREHGFGGATLADQEGAQERDRQHADPARRGDDRVDAQHQGCGDQRRAEHVGSLRKPEPATGGQQPVGERRRGDAEGHVDEEDPVPADRLRDQAARHQPQRGARRGDEAEDAEGLRLLLSLREQGNDHREDDGGAGRPADALGEAGGDQDRLRRREPAG